MVASVSLQEAADQLGVHYMTAYRYVRHGLLPAEKVGATWRVAAADVERFRHRPAARRGPRARAPWDERLENRLRAGDELGAWGVVEAALAAGATPAAVYLEVLGPALRAIGDAWEAGVIDVGVEHRASVIAMRVVGRLGPRFARRGRSRGTVVLGAPPGELHALPVAMLADLVRGAGFRPVDLGADVPVASYVRVVTESAPLVAAVVTVTTPDNERSVRALVGAVREACPAARVLVGGGAVVDRRLATSLGSDGWAPDAPGALSLLEGARAG